MVFWSYVRTKMKTKETIENLQDNNGQVKTDNLVNWGRNLEYLLHVFLPKKFEKFTRFPG